MYHHGYGSVVHVPGSDLAVAIIVGDDNSGPHSPAEIANIYSALSRQFPNAQITACGLTEIANAIEPFRKNLPTVTQEIGDTWIYGVASDPVKVARYREISRLRRSWIASGKFQSGDATDIALLRKLLLEAEHTWGTDTKTWLDFDNYMPRDLAKMLDTKNYKVVEFSWTEKRQDLHSKLFQHRPSALLFMRIRSERADLTALTSMANGSDTWLRQTAIQALANSGDPRAREYLRTALQDPALPDGLRTTVIRGLGREYATGRDIDLLRARYATLTSVNSKQAVLSVLAEEGGAANLQWLLTVAGTPMPRRISGPRPSRRSSGRGRRRRSSESSMSRRRTGAPRKPPSTAC